MPQIHKVFDLQVTPEQFVNACTEQELYELSLILNNPRFQRLFERMENPDYEAPVATDLNLVWYDPDQLPEDAPVKCSHCQKPIFQDQKKPVVLRNEEGQEVHLHSGCYIQISPHLYKSKTPVRPADRTSKGMIG